MHAFFLNQLILFSCAYFIFFTFGSLVYKGLLKPNYSRKIVSFVFFITILVVDHYYPRELSSYYFFSTLLIVIYFLSFCEFLRERSIFLLRCFRAVARPEDHPHSLRWIITEYLVMYCVVSLCLKIMGQFGVADLIMLPLYIILLADGLAEPVGIRFGRNKYSTRALYTRQRYTRSLEGSACVFIVTLVIVFYYADAFGSQWLCALFIIPLTVTLAEALSPHTCDGPLITVCVTADIILLSYIS